MTASSTPSTQHASSGDRLAVVRRIYFYLVALASFIAGLVAFDRLVDILTVVWLDPSDTFGSSYIRNTIAASGGALLVSVPIFLIHWRLAMRSQDDMEERRSAWRKFFLYAASAVTTGFALFHAYELLYGTTLLILGTETPLIDILPSRWLYLSIMIGVNLALTRYFYTVLIQDGDYGTEVGAAGTLRRLYMLLASLIGLGLIILGGARLIEGCWRLIFDDAIRTARIVWWQTILADGVAKLLVGALLWRINWVRWRRIIADHAGEAHTVLRSIALYAAVVIGAVATLVPAAMLLRELLLLALPPDSTTVSQMFSNIAEPISYLPIGLIAWYWHWRFLRQTMSRYGESAETVLIRRLYTYLVAAVGLALLWFGIAEVVQSLLDWFFVTNNMQRATSTGAVAESGYLWTQPLATGLSLIAVGAPIWSIHWRAGQTIAARADAAGLAERASGPRRAYLFGVALVGALLILFYLARVIYRILLLALGDPDAMFFSTVTAQEMASAAIAVIFWLVHVRAIREDGRLGTQLPETTPVAPVEAFPVEQGDDRNALIARIERLETELAAARAQLQELERQALEQ